MSTWSAFVAWRRQRLPLLPFVGVAVVVAAAAGRLTPAAILSAFMWIMALRLWDDVAARDDDARRHPERVVVRGPRPPFSRAAAVAVFAAAIVSALQGALFGFVLVVLGVGALLLRPLPSLLQRLALLLKYPAMAALLATTAPPTVPSATNLLLLYSCFVVDEFISGEAPLPARALPFVLTFFFLS